MQTPTWNSLPADILQELLLKSPNFATVIQLVETNKQIQAILGCRSVITNPHLTSLLTETYQCQLLPSQLQLLRQLSDKFHLQVEDPLTFANLKRAYNRSALNSRCVEHSSLVNCLKSAARLGISSQLRPSLEAKPSLWDKWLAEYQQLLMTPILDFDRIDVVDFEKDITDADWYMDFLARLAIIAYKNGHLDLGSSLTDIEDFAAEGRLTDELLYWEAKAYCKVALRPYKVFTSKQIRSQYSKTLFDPNIPDQEKAEIWRSKYQLTEDDIRQLKVKAEHDSMYFMVLAKLGIFYDHPHVVDVKSTLSTFSVMSNRPDLIDANGSEGINVILAVKRGYFELAKNLRPSTYLDLPLDVFAKSKYIYEFLKKFTLDEAEQFYRGFTVVFTVHWLFTTLLAVLISGNCTRLYFEYIDEHGSDEPAVLIRTKSLAISDDVIRRLASSHNDRLMVTDWLNNNPQLLTKIWIRYGRQQFEDALLYLAAKFGVTVIASRLIQPAIRSGSLSLVAYLFGYRIDAQNQLSLLASPGIVKLDIEEFVDMILDGRVDRLSPRSWMFDMLLMLITILDGGSD